MKDTINTEIDKEPAPLYAEVIIPLNLPKNYTWLIPYSLQALVKEGSRVEVNLGKHKKYAGIVKNISSDQPLFKPKEIISVIDEAPLLQKNQINFWEWVSQYYACSEGEVMAAALPSHFKLSSETLISFHEEFGEDFSDLSNEEFIVAEALSIKKELRLSEIQELLDSKNVYPIIQSLIEKGLCYVWEELKHTYREKQETYIHLAALYEQEERLEELLNGKSLQRAEKQMSLLLAYLHLQKTEPPVTRTALLKKSMMQPAHLKALLDKGILISEKRAVNRLHYLPKKINIDFALNEKQQEVYDSLQKGFLTTPVWLLHGVTGSGKTYVYIQLIADIIKKGKQALYLLPEIALTAQIIRKLQHHFGGHIGIYHSRFSHNERVEIWEKVKNGELNVVLGTRSSIFLPFKNLELIICDEEHDSSYKQQDTDPRYNARDAAIYYASQLKAQVLLGSATPSVESYHQALKGKYGLLNLTTRYNDLKLPPIEIVDTRGIALVDGIKLSITPRLKQEIEHTIGRQKQVILFQNRRGYHPYQICTVCSWIPTCKHCDVSLTYHKHSNKLVCHYCGSTYPVLNTCMACGSHAFAKKNFGTEHVEEQLEEIFPEAHIARLDADTMRGKHSHENIIQLFEQRKYDILVGTQVVVKGLDIEHVELAGILDADGLLSFNDFRVNERCFQLIEQASGRAGRRQGKSLVIIQTAQPKHPLLVHVQQHDYNGMYTEEIKKRYEFLYPPFTRLIRITIRNRNKELSNHTAHTMVSRLKQHYEPYILGPSEPVVSKIRNQFLMEVLLKLPRNNTVLAACKKEILESIAYIKNEKTLRYSTFIIDVDPY